MYNKGSLLRLICVGVLFLIALIMTTIYYWAVVNMLETGQFWLIILITGIIGIWLLQISFDLWGKLCDEYKKLSQ